MIHCKHISWKIDDIFSLNVNLTFNLIHKTLKTFWQYLNLTMSCTLVLFLESSYLDSTTFPYILHYQKMLKIKTINKHYHQYKNIIQLWYKSFRKSKCWLWISIFSLKLSITRIVYVYFGPIGITLHTNTPLDPGTDIG